MVVSRYSSPPATLPCFYLRQLSCDLATLPLLASGHGADGDPQAPRGRLHGQMAGRGCGRGPLLLPDRQAGTGPGICQQERHRDLATDGHRSGGPRAPGHPGVARHRHWRFHCKSCEWRIGRHCTGILRGQHAGPAAGCVPAAPHLLPSTPRPHGRCCRPSRHRHREHAGVVDPGRVDPGGDRRAGRRQLLVCVEHVVGGGQPGCTALRAPGARVPLDAVVGVTPQDPAGGGGWLSGDHRCCRLLHPDQQPADSIPRLPICGVGSTSVLSIGRHSHHALGLHHLGLGDRQRLWSPSRLLADPAVGEPGPLQWGVGVIGAIACRGLGRAGNRDAQVAPIRRAPRERDHPSHQGTGRREHGIEERGGGSWRHRGGAPPANPRVREHPPRDLRPGRGRCRGGYVHASHSVRKRRVLPDHRIRPGGASGLRLVPGGADTRSTATHGPDDAEHR